MGSEKAVAGKQGLTNANTDSSITTKGDSGRASETLSGLYKFKLMRYVYIYIYGGTCAIIVAHAPYT